MVDSTYEGCYEKACSSYNIDWARDTPLLSRRKQKRSQGWFSWQQCPPCSFLCSPEMAVLRLLLLFVRWGHGEEKPT